MAETLLAENLQPDDIYIVPGHRRTERLRRVKALRFYSTGTLPMVMIENVDVRSDRETGALSILRATTVERVTELDGDWDQKLCDMTDDLEDGQCLRVWHVGGELYA